MSRQPWFKPEVHAEVLRLRAEGLLQREIAERLGICQQRVSQILARHRKLQERAA